MILIKIVFNVYKQIIINISQIIMNVNNQQLKIVILKMYLINVLLVNQDIIYNNEKIKLLIVFKMNQKIVNSLLKKKLIEIHRFLVIVKNVVIIR